MSSGWEDGLNWMMARHGKAQRRIDWVKGASEDLARRRSLDCWEELESLMGSRGAADVA